LKEGVMPLIGNFRLRWSPEQDQQLLLIGRKYRRCKIYTDDSGKPYRKWLVDWDAAYEAGALRGLPLMPFCALSKRHGIVREKAKDPVAYNKKKLKINQKWYKRVPKSIRNGYYKKSVSNRLAVFNSIKHKIGYKSKIVWNKEQQDLLLKLTKKHRKSEITIDWVSLIKDPAVKRLPATHNNSIYKLRKYYWRLVQLQNPKFVKKHRRDALRWKQQNKGRYHSNQRRRYAKIRQAVNDYLHTGVSIFH